MNYFVVADPIKCIGCRTCMLAYPTDAFKIVHEEDLTISVKNKRKIAAIGANNL